MRCALHKNRLFLLLYYINIYIYIYIYIYFYLAALRPRLPRGRAAGRPEPAETSTHASASRAPSSRLGLPSGGLNLSNASCLMHAASFVLCVFRRVYDHYHLLRHSSLSKSVSVREVVLDKWFPLAPAKLGRVAASWSYPARLVRARGLQARLLPGRSIL